MADMVTKQELEAAKIDVKHAGEAVNEEKVVKTRLGRSFKSIPLIVKEGEAKITQAAQTITNATASILSQKNQAAQTISQAESDVVTAATDVHQRGNQEIINLQNAIDIAAAAGAGENGWTAQLIVDESGKSQQQINNSIVYEVDDLDQLRVVNHRKNKQVVYVKSLQANYTYYEDTNQPENGVTVVGKWVMDTQPAYYASWFATPNVQVDQKSKLRIGYAYATLKQRPFIIDDIFWIGVTSGDHVGLSVLSNSKLSFKMGVGGLKLLPNNLDRYNMVRFYGCENFKVTHLSIEGDRLTHTGTTGEWGHGLSVEDCKNGLIYMPKILNTWGDGIDVGRSITDGTFDYDPTDIIIYAPTVDRARRNGISFKSFNNVKIINPIIKKVGNYNGVNATSPRSGIDVEPNDASLGTRPQCIGGLITNPRIEDCTVGLIISNNQDREFEITVSGSTYIKNCRVPLELYNNSELSRGSAIIESVVIDGLYVGGAAGDPAQNAIINLGWNGASLLSVNVNSLKICKNIPKVVINKILPTVDYASLNFGNIFIRDIDFEQGSIVEYKLSAKDAIYTDNIVLLRSEKCRGSITINAVGYDTTTAAGKKGVNYFVDGTRTLVTGDGVVSVRYPSKILINGGALSSDFTLNTDNDFSTRTVEYSPSSTSTTYNLVVSNLKLTIDGETKLGAVTNQRGARITYRKTEGATEIVELLGNWTFI